MKIIMKKSDWMDNWYIIELAEHDGREWIENDGPNSFSFKTSARFSDADVEGTDAEMLAIASAIKNGKDASFRRCAVRISGGLAFFSSPRNSEIEGECSLSEAEELAEQIEKELKKD